MNRETFYRHRLEEYRVPEHLHEGLVNYLVYHQRPGSFLSAVLQNNLLDAMLRADDASREGLFRLVFFLYNVAPNHSWSSPRAFFDWLEQRGQI